jgi:hypothetical protein
LPEGQPFEAFTPCLPADPLALLLVADSGLAAQQYGQARGLLAKYSEALKARRSTAAGSVGFLRWVLRNTHHQLLRRFVAYAPFGRLLEEGVYNCVSASALFALLLETTDPYAGLVSGKRAVARRVARYSRPDATDWCAKAALCTVAQGEDCPAQFSQPINLKELAGLQCVNQAISYYNRLELSQARYWLQKAEMLYPASRRISGLKNYLAREEARIKDLSRH